MTARRAFANNRILSPQSDPGEVEGLLSVEASRKHVRVILPRRFNAELLELTHSAQTIRAQDGEHCWYSFFHTADVALAATIAPP